LTLHQIIRTIGKIPATSMRTAFYQLVGFLTCIVLGLSASVAGAGALFQDGYIGLTKAELRSKLGLPHKVRTRVAAQRVYRYFSFEAWEKEVNTQMGTTTAEDVYIFTRDGVTIRYSFHFVESSSSPEAEPDLMVDLVDIECVNTDPTVGPIDSPVTAPHPVPIAQLTTLVPEFTPSEREDAPTFRSNLFVILVQAPPASEARRLVKDPGKDHYDWSLAYRLYNTDGFPMRISLTDTITRMEFSIDSVQLIKDHQKLTHEPMINPFSSRANASPPASEPAKKKIPMPRYAP
jgi:hypothetical protein